MMVNVCQSPPLTCVTTDAAISVLQKVLLADSPLSRVTQVLDLTRFRLLDLAEWSWQRRAEFTLHQHQ